MQMMLTGDGELRGPPLGSMFVAPLVVPLGAPLKIPSGGFSSTPNTILLVYIGESEQRPAGNTEQDEQSY